MADKTIYLRFRKKVKFLAGKNLFVKDLCFVTGYLASEINDLAVYKMDSKLKNIVVDAIGLIQNIKNKIPEVEIVFLGTPFLLVEREILKKPFSKVCLFVSWLILFLGSGLAIMHFHADVDMPEVHKRIYYLFTGELLDHAIWLELPYAIGIGFGMILFFNDGFSKNKYLEPSPLEIQTFQYQDSIDQYILNNPYDTNTEFLKEIKPVNGNLK